MSQRDSASLHGGPLTIVAGLGGAALVVFVFVDALATTLSVRQGAGPLTRRFVDLTWKLILTLFGHDRRSRVLAAGGSLLLFLTVVLWVSCLWLGWALVFWAGGPAVIDATSRVPASFADTAYFVGFTVFTLGVGDFVAESSGWRLLSTIASFSGLFLVTLAITYLLSAIGAVVSRRAVAVHIHGLGASGAEMVTVGWDGSDFSSAFVEHLITLSSEIATITEQHMAYPILHTFYSLDREVSAPIAVAELYDAYLLLAHGVAPDVRPSRGALRTIEFSIRRYAATVQTTSGIESEEPAPPIALEPLREAGVPLVDEAVFRDAVVDRDERRRVLTAIVLAGGWTRTALTEA